MEHGIRPQLLGCTRELTSGGTAFQDRAVAVAQSGNAWLAWIALAVVLVVLVVVGGWMPAVVDAGSVARKLGSPRHAKGLEGHP